MQVSSNSKFINRWDLYLQVLLTKFPSKIPDLKKIVKEKGYSFRSVKLTAAAPDEVSARISTRYGYGCVGDVVYSI